MPFKVKKKGTILLFECMQCHFVDLPTLRARISIFEIYAVLGEVISSLEVPQKFA